MKRSKKYPTWLVQFRTQPPPPPPYVIPFHQMSALQQQSKIVSLKHTWALKNDSIVIVRYIFRFQRKKMRTKINDPIQPDVTICIQPASTSCHPSKTNPTEYRFLKMHILITVMMIISHCATQWLCVHSTVQPEITTAEGRKKKEWTTTVPKVYVRDSWQMEPFWVFFENERNGKVPEMMLHAAFAECKLCYLFYTVGMFDLTCNHVRPGVWGGGVCDVRVCTISCNASRESIWNIRDSRY